MTPLAPTSPAAGLVTAALFVACAAPAFRKDANRPAWLALAASVPTAHLGWFLAGPRNLDSSLQEVLRGADLMMALLVVVLAAVGLSGARRAGGRAAGWIAFAVVGASFTVHGIHGVVAPEVPETQFSARHNFVLERPPGRWRPVRWRGPQVAMASIDTDVTLLLLVERNGIELGRRTDDAVAERMLSLQRAGPDARFSIPRAARAGGIEGQRFLCHLTSQTPHPFLEARELSYAVWIGHANGFGYELTAVAYTAVADRLPAALDRALEGFAPLDPDLEVFGRGFEEVGLVVDGSRGYEADLSGAGWWTSQDLLARYPGRDRAASLEGRAFLTVATVLLPVDAPADDGLDTFRPVDALEVLLPAVGEPVPRSFELVQALPDDGPVRRVGIRFRRTDPPGPYGTGRERIIDGVVALRRSGAHVILAEHPAYATSPEVRARIEEALEAFRFAEVGSFAVDAARSARVAEGFGRADARRGRWQEALAWFERAETLDPEGALGLDGRVEALVRLGRDFDALELLSTHPGLLDGRPELRDRLTRIVERR